MSVLAEKINGNWKKGQWKEQEATMDDTRKTYYVSVGAGQVLEDPEAAAFEFSIRANEEELSKLQERFDDLSTADETTAFRFADLLTASDEQTNQDYDAQLLGVYRMLYELGTEETRRHMETEHLLEGDDLGE